MGIRCCFSLCADLTCSFVARHYALASVGKLVPQNVCAGLSPTAVLAFYEIAITMDREVDTVWTRKFSFVTVLWCFVRACWA